MFEGDVFMSFVFFTSLEIFMAIALILEIKNKDKLIEFERKMVKRIRRRIKKTICDKKDFNNTTVSVCKQLKKSA